MVLIISEVTQIPTLMRVQQLTKPIHGTLFPLPEVCAPIGPPIKPKPVYFVIEQVSNIVGAIGPGVLSRALFLAIYKRSCE